MLKNNLIYDVGMHKGEDTDFYLNKGFKVIGFEADPELIVFCKSRFKNEITKKRLIIVEGAIVDKISNSKVKFYKNTANTVWGTILPEWAERNKMDKATSEITYVNEVDFSECLKKYGVPYYLKIDIEGMDVHCCETLLNFNEKPNYISIESEKKNFNLLINEISLFKKLGYDKFKIIQQDGISKQKENENTIEGKYVNCNFVEGSSGLFGSDLPGEWLSESQAINKYKKIFFYYKLFGDYSILRKFIITRLLLKLFRKFTGIPCPGWYDTHAKNRNFK